MGVEQGEGLDVVDLKAFDPSMPSTMRELLELGDKGLQCAQRYETQRHIVTVSRFITKYIWSVLMLNLPLNHFFPLLKLFSSFSKMLVFIFLNIF